MVDRQNPNESDMIKKRFAAYLRVALIRKRKEYLNQRHEKEQREFPLDESLSCPELLLEEDLTAGLSLFDQIENEPLRNALSSLSAFEYHLVYLRAVEGLSYQDMAQYLHENYWTVKSAYLRAIRKLRERL